MRRVIAPALSAAVGVALMVYGASSAQPRVAPAAKPTACELYSVAVGHANADAAITNAAASRSAAGYHEHTPVDEWNPARQTELEQAASAARGRVGTSLKARRVADALDGAAQALAASRNDPSGDAQPAALNSLDVVDAACAALSQP